MRIGFSGVALALFFANASSLACSCPSMAAPMAGEAQSAWTERVWLERLKRPYSKHVFIGTVEENIGWYRAMTERKGQWPVKLSAIEVLTGSPPPNGTVFHNNSCGANAPVGSKIVVLTDDSFDIGMCNIERLEAGQTELLRKLVLQIRSAPGVQKENKPPAPVKHE